MAVRRWRDDPWGRPTLRSPTNPLSPNAVAAATQRGPLGTVGRSPPVRPVRSSGCQPPLGSSGTVAEAPPHPSLQSRRDVGGAGQRRNVDAPREGQRRARLPPRRGLACRRPTLGKQPCTNGQQTGAWRGRAADRRQRASRLLQPPGGAARLTEKVVAGGPRTWLDAVVWSGGLAVCHNRRTADVGLPPRYVSRLSSVPVRRAQAVRRGATGVTAARGDTRVRGGRAGAPAPPPFLKGGDPAQLAPRGPPGAGKTPAVWRVRWRLRSGRLNYREYPSPAAW